MLCVIAKLDKRSTEKLTAIQKAAAPDADGKPLHGHITLAAYMGEDEAGFMAFCAALLKDVSRFAVKYTHLAVLEETSIVAALVKLNNQLSAEKEETAALKKRLIAEMAAGFAPFTAGIVGIEFSRVTPPGYEILGRTDLRD